MAGPWEKYRKAEATAVETKGPWTKYKSAPAPDEDPEPKTSAAQAALEHYGNSATLGYLPHLQAMAEKLMPDPNQDLDAELRSRGFNVPDSSRSYVANRDANAKRLTLESEEHPTAAGAGKLGGMVATALVPAGSLARGAGLGAKAIQGAKIGAAYGAIANPGDVEGEVDPFQAGDRAKGAAFGAALGAAVPVAAAGVEAGAGKLAQVLRNKAALKATRALGRPTPSQSTQMAATGQDATLGRELLDQGAIPVLGTPERIAGRVEAIKEKAGQSISDIIDKAGDSKSIDAEKLGLQILDSSELQAMRKTPGMESSVAAIEKQVETLAKNGQMNLKEAQALRQGIDRSINFNKAAPEMRGAQEGLYQQRTAIRNAMNDSVNAMNEGGTKDALLTANRRYGNMATASDILEREVGRNQANRAVSLTDTVAGAAGMLKGGPIGAALLAGANKAGRTFGNSVQARAYDAVAKQLPTVGRAASAVSANPMAAQAVAQRIGRSTTDSPLSTDAPESGTEKLGTAPLRGEDRWASRGAENLGIQDTAMTQKLMQSKEAKRLLIEASDMKPGSRALLRVKEQIEAISKGLSNDSLSGNPSKVLRQQREPSGRR